MTALPHGPSDMFLAPVVLALDARIAELGSLTARELRDRVVHEAELADFSTKLRREGLLKAVRRHVDCHGWELFWDPRGIRVVHGHNELVLGVPATFGRYVTGPAEHA
jgi:hypothetical protein